MHNKGLIRLFAILFGIVSIYQLSFTFITNKVEDEAETYATQKISEEVPDFGDLRQQARTNYLDSVANKPVFAGITYEKAKGKQLNKGLDLKGGLSVILQISVHDLLNELSNHSKNPAFQKALAEADEAQEKSQDTYINLFFKAFDKIPDAKLASPDIFGNKNLSGAVTFNMTNEQVKQVIAKRVDESITSAFQVLRQRVDKFGVAQPNIQRLGESGQILIELPGAEDVSRAKNLLQSTAQLEFWHVYQAKDFSTFLQRADAELASLQNNTKKAAVDTTQQVADSSKTQEADIEALLSDDDQSSAEENILNAQNPLLSLVKGTGYPTGPILAQFAVSDTAKVNEMLHNPKVRALLSADKRYARFAWGMPDKKTGLVGLYAIKSNKRNEAPLTGSVVTNATQVYDQFSQPAVSLEMDATGAKIWENMTGEAYKQGTQIAIVLDNTVYSAPGVTTGAIAGGRSQITGNFDINEAKDLATVLEAGKLPAKASIVQIEIVGPSLGQEAINTGIISFALALGIVLIYMIFYYGRAGLYADIALLVNLLFIFGILAGLGAVLTLPGIAGIILTIGMSVDANVLIFERSREEIHNGKSNVAAINDGFKEALSSIIDSNLTTALTGVILLVFGTGPVKGFAVTLLIGICTSLFTAIYVTRLFVDKHTRNGKPLKFSTNITKNWFSNIHINITAKRKIVYVISGSLILISLISIFTRGFNQGVDFVGGRSYTVRFDHDVNAPEIQDELLATFGSAEAIIYGSNNQLKITTKYKVDEQGQAVENEILDKLYTTLKPEFPANLTLAKFKTADTKDGIGVMSSIKVGPSIAEDTKVDSFYAVLASIIGIFLYIMIRFKKWQFSLGATLALVHDTIILLGIFSIFRGMLPFSMEINQDFIAAILTVIGYSINDTVVVFDRIREYLNWHPKWTLKENVNESISSTLSRTFNTGMTVFLVLLVIFLFGSESIRAFVFCIMIGVVVGTYSSVFVASPIMYDTLKKKGDDILNKKLGE